MSVLLGSAGGESGRALAERKREREMVVYHRQAATGGHFCDQCPVLVRLVMWSSAYLLHGTSWPVHNKLNVITQVWHIWFVLLAPHSRIWFYIVSYTQQMGAQTAPSV
jgi:hypothetical protein